MAARRIIPVMGRWILLPSVKKAISILIETIEGESRFRSRANATTDSSRYLFPTVACANVSWPLPGVAFLVSMATLVKSPQTFLYFLAASLLARMIY